MKSIKILIGIMLILFAFTACDKEESGIDTGIPKGNKVSTAKALDQAIVKGSMGDWIALHGEHQAKPTSIKFNDIEVDLKEIYVENNIIYLQVPVKMPLEVNNLITVGTASGETSYPFEVNIPNLELTGMFNEYTLPGDTIKIYGKFLKLYEVDATTTTISFDGIESPVIFANDTYLTTRVPTNAGTNIKVKAVNKKFDVTAECKGYYRDKHNVITSFDADFPYKGGTNANWLSSGPVPKALQGQYIRFEVDQTKYPNGLGWFYLMENSYNYTLDMVQHPENYELKFELNMNVPIQKTKFFIYYYWAHGPTAIGSEYFNVQNLNTWQTVTIPLDKIIPTGITTTSTSYSLNFRVENFSPVERVAMYFDNIRIYKKGS